MDGGLPYDPVVRMFQPGTRKPSDHFSTAAREPGGANLTQISSDPFTIGPGQHATEVEPHLLANGNTLVATFQVGRISDGGATDVGWATSTDGGNSWAH